jgi:hypothetical protein
LPHDNSYQHSHTNNYTDNYAISDFSAYIDFPSYIDIHPFEYADIALHYTNQYSL